ncbi:MAG: amidohydrolase family protein [Isosphaeraceae bacterium]
MFERAIERLRIHLLTVLSLLTPTALARAGEAQPLVIRHASVFDAGRAAMQPDRTIVIEGENIKEIGSPDRPVAIPSGARILDGSGRFVIPGLIDAHVHLVHLADRTHVTGDEFLPLFLAAGVTSVRSAGDAIVAEAGVAHFAEAHPDRCPRVFLASPLIDGPTPTHRDVGYSLVDVARVAPFVEDMARWRATTLKIYVGTPREVGRAVIREGHRRGLVVAGHLGVYSAQDAVEDGIDCLEHIWSVFNYAIPSEVTSRPDHRADLDLDNPRCRDLVAAIARRRVAVDPTLVVFRNMIYLNDLPEVREHPDQRLAPARMRHFWDSYARSSNLPPASRELRRKEVRKYQELTGMLHRAGVTILAGTDTPEPFVTPGFSLHQELELLVESGLTPAVALQSATYHNAAILKQSDRLGRIAPGLLADLVVLTADPTAEIRHTRRIEYIIRGGRVIRPGEALRHVPTE